MRQLYIFLLIGCALFWFLGVFYSYVASLKKSIKKQPSFESSEIKDQSKSMVAETESKRKRLMEERQRLLDTYKNRSQFGGNP